MLPIDPGTLTAVTSLLTGSNFDLNSILNNLMGMTMGADPVDPEALMKIKDEIKDLGIQLTTGAAALEDRLEVLSNKEDERDKLHEDANKSHQDLLDAFSARKQREQNA